MTADANEHERLRALLDATHRFPGTFYLSVIARTEPDVSPDLRRVVMEVTEGPLEAWERRASGNGRYTSHRLTVSCRSADDALELYARVARIEGVMTVL